MGEYTIWYIILNFVLTIFGVIAHFLKKKIKGESVDDIINYFKSHFKNTLTTLIAVVVAFVSLAAAGGLGWTASFLLGYTADSMFNKADGNT